MDFFAVKLSLSYVDWPTNDIACFLKHPDGAVNMMEMLELAAATNWQGQWYYNYLPADAYLKATEIAQAYGNHAVTQVTSGGIPLSEAFVNAMVSSTLDGYNRSGNVILLEARPGTATTNALVLEVRSKSDGKVVCTGALPLMLDSVTNMYRKVNLRNMQNPGSLLPPEVVQRVSMRDFKERRA